MFDNGGLKRATHIHQPAMEEKKRIRRTLHYIVSFNSFKIQNHAQAHLHRWNRLWCMGKSERDKAIADERTEYYEACKMSGELLYSF